MSGHPILPSDPISLPLLPLRDVVVFPHMVIPLFVGRPKSIKALEAAMEAGRQIMLVAQKAAGKDEPKAEDMFEIGCVSSILQMLKLPDGTVKVLVEGVQRANTQSIDDSGEFFTSVVVPVQPEAHVTPEVEALRRAVTQQFDQYVKLNKKIPPEILTSISGIDDAGRLADTIAAHLPLKLESKQAVLDLFSVSQRLEKLLEQLEHEVDILQVEKRIRGRVKRQMEKSQREYYLNEQVKAIQKELGEGEEGADLEELAKKIESARMSKEARKKAEGELKKLRLMSPMSAEATVVRNFIDTLVGLPWSKKSKIKHDLAHAEEVLNEDHYGLDKVKERILEYLAVQQRVDKVKAPILCLVGPPGVGKTSLGQSIARATGRKFVRMALGGVRDEAEIRGHRRTYVGAMPGRFVRALRDAGIDRSKTYVTNAVKHFKFVPRGKIRLHQKPTTPEIKACRRWYERELAAVTAERDALRREMSDTPRTDAKRIESAHPCQREEDVAWDFARELERELAAAVDESGLFRAVLERLARVAIGDLREMPRGFLLHLQFQMVSLNHHQ